MHNNVGNDDCIILGKCIYGLLQAVKHYNKMAIDISRKSEFSRGHVDSYLCMKMSTKGIVYIASYVDNYLIIGNPKATDEAIEQL